MILVRAETSPSKHALLWFHGFNADAETHRPELERFARAGFDAYGIDAVGHGSRRWPDLDARVAAPREEAKRTMLEIVDATAAEAADLVRSLLRDGYASVSIAGVSMGGYVVYRMLLMEPRIRAAVALLGSPEALEFARFSATRLLSITAENDENVPPHAARALHDFLGNSATNYIELRGVAHLLDAESWNHAIEVSVTWLARHVADEGDELRSE